MRVEALLGLVVFPFLAVSSQDGFVTRHGSLGMIPTPGCWEVTGRVGNASETFVTSVVKIGDGPSWHRDVP